MNIGRKIPEDYVSGFHERRRKVQKTHRSEFGLLNTVVRPTLAIFCWIFTPVFIFGTGVSFLSLFGDPLEMKQNVNELFTISLLRFILFFCLALTFSFGGCFFWTRKYKNAFVCLIFGILLIFLRIRFSAGDF